MNEPDFANKIRATLDKASVSGNAIRRLATAREQALAHARFQPESLIALAGYRASSFWHRHHTLSLGLITLLMIAALGAGWQWQHKRAAEQAIDVQLLSDELPLEVFVSGHFEHGDHS